jgi:hypothetical protein
MGRGDDVLKRYDTHRRAVTEILKDTVQLMRSELHGEVGLLVDTLYDFERLELRPVHVPETVWKASEAATILVAGSLRDRAMISRLYRSKPSWPVLYALARNVDTPAEILDDMAKRLRSQADRDIRLMIARNPGTGLETVDLLVRDSEDIVAKAAEVEQSAWAEQRTKQQS